MKKIVPEKICSCGKIHAELPANAKEQGNLEDDALAGWFFNCECRSTLFVPKEKIK